MKLLIVEQPRINCPKCKRSLFIPCPLFNSTIAVTERAFLYRVSQKKMVHTIFSIVWVLAPVLVRSYKNNVCFLKILFIAVILNIIDFLIYKSFLRYEYNFYISRGDNISLASSQILVNREFLIVQTHIPRLLKASDNLLC